ncbi:Solute carrier family 13 member 3, partial [Ophiophagus hannah]
MAALGAVVKKVWCIRRYLVLLCAPLVLLPILFSLPPKEGKCLYVILVMAIYWCTEALPLSVTALLPIILFPFLGILPANKVCPQYFLDTNFLFLSGLTMAAAIEEWNLHRRIALRILMLVGVQPARLILGMMLTTSFLSMWLSSVHQNKLHMVPIEMQLLSNANEKDTIEEKEVTVDISLDVMKEEQDKTNVWKAFLISIPYAASIGGTATLTGTAPNLILSGQLKSYFPGCDVVNFGSWFVFAFPLMLLFLFLGWLWICCLYGCISLRDCKKKKSKIRAEAEGKARAVIMEDYEKLGPIKFAEQAVFVLFCLFALLLFSRDPKFITGWASLFKPGFVSDAVTGITIVTILFFFPAKKPSLKWWFDLKGKLLESGLSVWIGGRLDPLENLPPPVAVILITAVIAMFTEFASNTATIIIFLPVLAELAIRLKVNPLYLMIPGTVGCSFAFMLPVSTPPNSIAFASGHLMVKDMQNYQQQGKVDILAP